MTLEQTVENSEVLAKSMQATVLQMKLAVGQLSPTMAKSKKRPKKHELMAAVAILSSYVAGLTAIVEEFVLKPAQAQADAPAKEERH